MAEGFYLTTHIEKYGSGFIRIRDALRDYPNISLALEEISGGLSVTFTQSQPPPLADSEGVDGGVSGGVSGGVNEIENLISKQPGINAKGIRTELRFSQRSTERWLKQLREEGKIEFKGSAKTGGYYLKENNIV